MKNVITLLYIAMLFSCKKNHDYAANVVQNPKMIFDGKNIIDTNRNDSIICNVTEKIKLPKKFQFTEKFNLKSFLTSNKTLKINKIDVFKNRNPFATYDCLNLNKFLSNDNITENPITYSIQYKNNKTTTQIVEFSFKTEKKLLTAYTIYANYSSFLRNLRRDKYQFRCSELFDEMFYYATIKSNKLYLISDSYNYTFSKPRYNIQDNISQNKEIIMDDIYKLLYEN